MSRFVRSPVAVRSAGAEGQRFNIEQSSLVDVTVALTAEAVAARAFLSGTAGVETGTFPSLALSDHQEFFVLYDTTGKSWGIALTNPREDVQELSLPTFASLGDGTFLVFTDPDGLQWALAFDKTGTSPEPTAPQWLAIPSARKGIADVSGATTAAQIGAIVETALLAITGFDGVFTPDDKEDGTVEIETVAKAPVAAVAVCLVANGSAAGAVIIAQVQTGQADVGPDVPAWNAIDAKSTCDISDEETDANVAAAVLAEFDALTGVDAVFGTNADDGDIIFTHLVRQLYKAPEAYGPDGVLDGGNITFANTTPAVASGFDLATNVLTFPNHGYLTGLKGQITSTGTPPTGLATTTDYFVIVVDQNRFKLASSKVNALAGTAINITAYGSGTQTFTPTAGIAGNVILQKNNAPSNETPVWVTVGSAAAYTGAGTHNFAAASLGAGEVRVLNDVSTGQSALVGWLNSKST